MINYMNPVGGSPKSDASQHYMSLAQTALQHRQNRDALNSSPRGFRVLDSGRTENFSLESIPSGRVLGPQNSFPFTATSATASFSIPAPTTAPGGQPLPRNHYPPTSTTTKVLHRQDHGGSAGHLPCLHDKEVEQLTSNVANTGLGYKPARPNRLTDLGARRKLGVTQGDCQSTPALSRRSTTPRHGQPLLQVPSSGFN
jgi:hypothetical protein